MHAVIFGNHYTSYIAVCEHFPQLHAYHKTLTTLQYKYSWFEIYFTYLQKFLIHYKIAIQVKTLYTLSIDDAKYLFRKLELKFVSSDKKDKLLEKQGTFLILKGEDPETFDLQEMLIEKVQPNTERIIKITISPPLPYLNFPNKLTMAWKI